MVPTEAQIREAGVRLGLIAEGAPIPPRLRGRLAKVVELAEAETAAEHAAADRSKTVSAPIMRLWESLDAIPDEPRARIIAALAPQLWRSTEGATR